MGDHYYLAIGSEQKGPYTLSQIQSMWRSGAITADALYCQQGFDEWVPISSLEQVLDEKPAHNGLREQHPASKRSESDKRILPALILCFFFGVIGAHAFYAGRPRQGFLFLALPVLAYLSMVMTPLSITHYLPIDLAILVLISIPIFTFFDLIRILIGSYTDKEGRKIAKWT